MKDTDKLEFKNIVVELLGAYGFDLLAKSEEEQRKALTIWWGALSQFPIERIRHGFMKLITEPVTLYGRQLLAGDLIAAMGESAESRRLKAQATIEKVIKNWGAGDLYLDDPVLLRLLHDERGRLERIGKLDERGASFEVKRLTEEYEALAARGVDWYPKALYHERNPHGYKVALGSDTEAVKQIASQGQSRQLLIQRGQYSDEITRKGEKKLLQRDFGKDQGRKVLADLKALTSEKRATLDDSNDRPQVGKSKHADFTRLCERVKKEIEEE